MDFKKGAIFAVLGGVCWGVSGSVAQFMFQSMNMDSRWLVPVRLYGAGIILMIICLMRYRDQLLEPWKSRTVIIKLLLYAVPGVAASQFLCFMTNQLSSAAVSSIMQDISPVIILLVTCVVGRRLPKVFEAVSIIMAIAGVFLLTTHGKFDGSGVATAALITGILSAVAVTVYNVAPGMVLYRFPMPVIQAWAFLVGGTCMTLAFRSWTYGFEPSLPAILGIAFVIIVGTLLSFGFYMLGVKYAGPGKAILFGFSEPVTAAVVSLIFLGTSFSWVDALGFALIFGMLLMNYIGNRKERGRIHDSTGNNKYGSA